ncbi:MAG: flagellar hook-basal body complex protein [Acidimicrobiia bacterium]|nr:flagellar hook-basal body complex protein [Acidimicrobiia bacterium]
MIRSMYSAISGLRNHQTMMDVVGDNIANVNSTGFKGSAVVFQDVLSQTLRGGGAATGALGGTNPAQVGLGARLAGVTGNFSQGALQRTGRTMDIAIQGDGFFVVEQGGQMLYSRAGSFSVDALGRIVTQEGAMVQGWQAGPNGAVDAGAPVTALTVPVGDLVPPVMTSEIRLGGSLPADAADGTALVSTVTVYDGQGNPADLTVTFTKTATNQWTATATQGDPAVAVALTDSVLTFDANGELTSPAAFQMGIAAGQVPGLGAIAVSLGQAGATERITQLGGKSTIKVLDQDGSAAGSLQSFNVSQDGQLVGSYSNGRTRVIGQIALASFANPEGLEKIGSSSYRATPNSGLAALGAAGAGGRGLLSTGTLEMSNVDLAQEFTNLIVAQRGFQANSRVITAADELLSDVVNLKR